MMSTLLLQTFGLWTVFLGPPTLWCQRRTGREWGGKDAARARPAAFVGVEARTLESWELIVGEWEVSVHVKGAPPSSRRSKRASATSCKGIDALFPPRRTVVSRDGGGGDSGGGSAARQDPHRQRRRNYECRLAMFANQTFVLRPADAEIRHQEPGDANFKSATQGTDADTVLPVRGEWSVLSNPYCVTDRYYDNLRLMSYPRVQRKQILLRHRWGAGGRQASSASASKTEGVVVSSDALRRIRLELHGHLRGHHTAGGLVRRIVGPDRYHRGRIRNGVVLITDDDRSNVNRPIGPRQRRERSWFPWPLGRPRKVVVATFTAKRRMPPFRQLIQELDDVHLTSFELYRFN